MISGVLFQSDLIGYATGHGDCTESSGADEGIDFLFAEEVVDLDSDDASQYGEGKSDEAT